MDQVVPFLLLALVVGGAWITARAIENPDGARDAVVNAAAGNGEVVLVGGARIGFMNFSTPLARLVLSQTGIGVSAPFMKRRFAWTGLARARLIQPLIPIGQGVELTSTSFEPVIFWANRGVCWALLDVIERHGVPVDRTPDLRL
jgi:hypothetical protein